MSPNIDLSGVAATRREAGASEDISARCAALRPRSGQILQQETDLWGVPTCLVV